MMVHLARFIQEEVAAWLRQRNGPTPDMNIETLPGSDPGTIPTSLRLDFSWTDYTTGRVHQIRMTITETISGS